MAKRFRRPPRTPLVLNTAAVYWSFAAWTIVLGAVLALAPDEWFGPQWRYFQALPHNGFWMGVVLLILGAAQLFTLWYGHPSRIKTLSVLFFLSGFTFWTAGILLAAEGILGGQDAITAPFMLYVGAHKLSHSAALWAHRKELARSE